ncbi:MAG: hypothetical protein KatS3mg129_2629 [Leptospiraceae bacterium]|nr:MAG: hypothetical protein KatS3mg129_2629 [Leptospiraceae bacterium]
MDFKNKTIVVLDVSQLPPPEPFLKIMDTLIKLKDNEVLKVLHRREPFPLYEELKKIGFNYYTKKINDQKFEIYIYKK